MVRKPLMAPVYLLNVALLLKNARLLGLLIEFATPMKPSMNPLPGPIVRGCVGLDGAEFSDRIVPAEPWPFHNAFAPAIMNGKTIRPKKPRIAAYSIEVTPLSSVRTNLLIPFICSYLHLGAVARACGQHSFCPQFCN